MLHCTYSAGLGWIGLSLVCSKKMLDWVGLECSESGLSRVLSNKWTHVHLWAVYLFTTILCDTVILVLQRWWLISAQLRLVQRQERGALMCRNCLQFSVFGTPNPHPCNDGGVKFGAEKSIEDRFLPNFSTSVQHIAPGKGGKPQNHPHTLVPDIPALLFAHAVGN